MARMDNHKGKKWFMSESPCLECSTRTHDTEITASGERVDFQEDCVNPADQLPSETGKNFKKQPFKAKQERKKLFKKNLQKSGKKLRACGIWNKMALPHPSTSAREDSTQTDSQE